MKLDVLLSCMHQTDTSLVSKTGIIGNAVIINQCDRNDITSIYTENGVVEIISTTTRGLTKSRNMAIARSQGDVCVLCDDDEILVDNYQKIILEAFEAVPDADVIAFDLANHNCSLRKKRQRLKFPKTMKICSCQISFRRSSIVNKGIKFDELLGAGTGNGAEEELKFLLDCQKAKLKIYYVPQVIATLSNDKSTWFTGFDKSFFENRGATTRYILGYLISSMYAVYYVLRKRKMYNTQVSVKDAFKSIFKGIRENKISKLARKS